MRALISIVPCGNRRLKRLESIKDPLWYISLVASTASTAMPLRTVTTSLLQLPWAFQGEMKAQVKLK